VSSLLNPIGLLNIFFQNKINKNSKTGFQKLRLVLAALILLQERFCLTRRGMPEAEVKLLP